MVHSVCHLVTGLRQYCRNVPRLQTSVRRPGVSVYYRILGNFWGRKLSWIGENTIFTVKTLADHSFLLCQKTPCPQILQRKLSQITTKPCNSRKFSPSKVSCYTVYNLPIYIYTRAYTNVHGERHGKRGIELLCICKQLCVWVGQSLAVAAFGNHSLLDSVTVLAPWLISSSSRILIH